MHKHGNMIFTYSYASLEIKLIEIIYFICYIFVLKLCTIICRISQFQSLSLNQSLLEYTISRLCTPYKSKKMMLFRSVILRRY